MKILNKKIEVIAFHNREDGESHFYKLKVNFFNAEKISRDNIIYKFNCSYFDLGRKITCELYYQLNNQIWTLYRVF